MANRIILGALLTLSLTLTPRLALSVPTKDVKKKSSSPSKVTKKSSTSTSKKAKSSSSRTSSAKQEEETPVQAGMISGGETAPRSSGRSVSETAPLMKVTPQRDGRFLLEPLSPKKTVTTPMSPPAKPTEMGSQRSSSSEPKYNRFEPWNFSDLILSKANAYRNAPYARGGTLATGGATDCSGFVQYIYHGFRIDLPRSSAEQAQVGKVVTQTMDFSKLLPGDLLFFRRGGHSVGHAGIYLGEGKMIHASNYRNGVTITDLRQPYYEGTFVVAKRVFEVKYPD